MIRRTRIPAIDCTCEVCGHRWYSVAKKLPESCANLKCRSREWNGVKKRVAKPKIELPRPVKVRDTVDLHLWTDDEVQHLKRSGVIVEDKGPFATHDDDEIPF